MSPRTWTRIPKNKCIVHQNWIIPLWPHARFYPTTSFFFFCSDFFSFAVVNFSLFVRQTSICFEYRIRVSNMSICIWTSERDLKNWISAFLLNLIDTKNIYSNSCIGCIWAFDRHETCTSQIIIIWYLGCTHEIGRYITLGRWALRMAMFYRLEHLTLNELG